MSFTWAREDASTTERLIRVAAGKNAANHMTGPMAVGIAMNMMTGTEGVLALAGRYGVANAATFIIDHIAFLKTGDAGDLARRCGEVLERVIEGFGVGTETSLALIGVGQVLLGNPLTVGSPAALVATNPVAVTCAAVGAIYYGWGALREGEREALLLTVGSAFGIGRELVRAVIDFALTLLRQLASFARELKRWLAEGVAAYGGKLSDVTRSVGDRAWEVSQSALVLAGGAASTVRQHLPRSLKH